MLAVHLLLTITVETIQTVSVFSGKYDNLVYEYSHLLNFQLGIAVN